MYLIKKIIITFIFLLAFTTIKVNALTNDTTISIEMIPHVYSNKETPYQNFWIQFDYLYVNGKIGYCIQPGVRITTRTYSSSDDFSLFNLSALDKHNLELISYYGYSYPNHQTLEYYMATQELIWRYLGITNLNFTTEANYGGNVIDIEYQKNEIKKLIEKHGVKPSFNGSTKKAVVGETIVYEDINGVLNDYIIVDSGNNHAWIDNNKLYVKINDKGLSEVKLRKIKYNNSNSHIYLANNSQTIATLNLTEDVESSIFVSAVYKGILNIKKQGNYIEDINNGNYTYKDKPLEGVSYDIYASTDIIEDGNLIYSKDTLVQTLITNYNGQATSDLLPLGSYYILEQQTDKNYIKDQDKYYFTFDEDRQINGIIYQNYDFYNNLKLGQYRIQKMGEKINGIVDNQFDYVLIELPNVKFGVFAAADIYNTNNQILASKDDMLFEIATNNDGIIDILLPIGSYYVKELTAPLEYELNDTKYYFDIDTDNLNISNNIVINKLKKSKLFVTKMDSDTRDLLADTSYNLYNNDELIMELTTNNMGKIEVELPFGNYLLKENKSKYGYLIDEKTYELNVLGTEDINMELFNKKIPMPITSDYQNNVKIISFFLFIIGSLLIYVCKDKNYN